MRKFKVQFTYLFALLATLFIAQSATAQSEAHYYQVTTWKIQVPEGGSHQEFGALLGEWHQKVDSKNPKILSSKVLRHVSGSDMRDVVVITEYATWNDIDEAGQLTDKLVEEGWPDEAKRKQFFDTFGKYAITHSDEILMGMPQLTK